MEDESSHIGGRLKAAREAAGLTVEDVVFRTRLPKSVVTALEAGDFAAFNSPLYAKSFLSQYADFLNVDAQLWIDALEPASFVPGDAIHPLIEPPEFGVVEKPPAADARGGWFPVLGLFALSAALVVAAMKSYEFFESRFGGEPARATADAPRAASQAPAAVPPKPPDRRPAIQREDEELGKPPPRAIIVR